MAVSIAQAEGRLQTILGLVEDELELSRGFLRVELMLATEKKMTELNRQFRDVDAPTDVLSFETNGNFRQQGLLGSLVICVPVLERQAKALKHTDPEELDILLLHGVLHLIGMDHEASPKKAREMKEAEEALLLALGGKKSGLIHRNQRKTSAKPASIKRKKTKR